MGQPSVINLRTFDLHQKGTLACLCSLTLWEFSLLLRYSDVLVTAVLAVPPNSLSVYLAPYKKEL